MPEGEGATDVKKADTKATEQKKVRAREQRGSRREAERVHAYILCLRTSKLQSKFSSLDKYDVRGWIACCEHLLSKTEPVHHLRASKRETHHVPHSGRLDWQVHSFTERD